MDRTDIPLARGALGGLIAYGLGFLVTYLWQAPSVRETLSGINALIELVGGETIPVWKAVGWVFYNAHVVSLQLPAFGPGSASRSLIGDGGAPTLLYVVPPLVILLVSAGLAWWVAAETPAAGATAGATVTIGYLVPVAIGAFLVRYTIQDAFIGPALASAVLLAGIVYPLVFGAIGGGLAGGLR